MSTQTAITAARHVLSVGGTDAKLDQLARAIEALAVAVANIEKAVQK